jgi:hypothetical protein
MNVGRKKWYHKLLRPLLNAVGALKGFSGCGICGDKWNWKKSHDVEYSWPANPDEKEMEISITIGLKKADQKLGYTNRGAAFPTCEECWQTKSADEIVGAACRLSLLWRVQSPGAKTEIQANAMVEAVDAAACARA